MSEARGKRLCASCGDKSPPFFLAWAPDGNRWCKRCAELEPNAVHRKGHYCQVCIEKRCSKPRNATFGESKARKWCREHAPKESLNVHRRVCSCGKSQPTLGRPGDTKATWCAKCLDRPPEAKNINARRCVCGKSQPIYGVLEKKAVWCTLCKEPGAVDVRHKKCVCARKVIPTFGYVGDTKATWCAHCPDKPENAVNVTAQRCQCGGAQPTFGLPNDISATWCIKCPTKNKEAVDIRSSRCVCGKAQPCFGNIDDDRPRWCLQCKPQTAVNIKDGLCVCGRARPTFGEPGDQRPRWCVKCPKKSEKAQDIVNKRCDCGGAFPWLAPVGEKRPIWCATCRPKDTEAEDVRSSRCKLCTTFVRRNRNAGYCLRCYVHTFPGQKVARNYKTKECTFVSYLRNALQDQCLDNQVLYDRQLGGCSKRRPDMAVECLTHVVFVEIDEDSHDTNDYCACENKRMMELFQDVAERPIVFIRVNPDGYVDSQGVRQPSCFKYDRHGLAVPRDKEGLESRLKVSWARLIHHIRTIPQREVTIEHLYYNGFH